MKTTPHPAIVSAVGEAPLFKPGDTVIITSRFPVGHYRVPRYIRGKKCVIEAVIEPRALNNEEEGFGRNAGQSRGYIVDLTGASREPFTHRGAEFRILTARDFEESTSLRTAISETAHRQASTP